MIGKTNHALMNQLFEEYESRLKHYLPFEYVIIPEIKNRKNKSISQQKAMESKLILEKINPLAINILLDEKGALFTSKGFAKMLQKRMNSGVRQINFIIGGPYGFSEEMYQKIPESLALSKMTFPHEMVRIFFVEQLYRAMTIIKNENYHHE